MTEIILGEHKVQGVEENGCVMVQWFELVAGRWVPLFGPERYSKELFEEEFLGE